jgi:4-amino-4-deoxy-L-arabinose transferase-like glycosyltransferase
MPRAEWLVLAPIVAFGAALRFTALGHNLPFAPGVDEPIILEGAVRMMKTGDLHPYFFDYPTLYFYVQLVVAVARFMTGAVNGLWATLDQAPAAEFYVWGRAVTAAFGTATIALTYLLARRLGAIAAATAALLVAAQSMHVRESHYVLTDVPLTFFVTLALLLAVRAIDHRRPARFFWAGVAAGLAAATKYHGGAVVLVPLAALVVTRGIPRRLASLALLAAGAIAAFLLFAPYTLLDLPGFLNGFATLAKSYAGVPPAPPWLTYLKHLRINLTTLGLAAAIGGTAASLVMAFAAAPGRRAVWASAGGFALLWFALLSTQNLVFGRYLLPLLPALAVVTGGAIALVLAHPRVRALQPLVRAGIAAGLVVAVAAAPAARSIEFVRVISKTSTNALAYAWVLEHVPPGSKVVIERRHLLLPDTYRWETLPNLLTRDFDSYVADGVEYVVAVDFTESPEHPDGRAYRDLFSRMELLKSFPPSADHPGPEVRVYRMPRRP